MLVQWQCLCCSVQHQVIGHIANILTCLLSGVLSLLRLPGAVGQEADVAHPSHQSTPLHLRPGPVSRGGELVWGHGI